MHILIIILTEPKIGYYHSLALKLWLLLPSILLVIIIIIINRKTNTKES